MPPAIEVRGLSKRYQLGLTHAKSLRELVNTGVGRLIGRKQRGDQSANAESSTEFWALRDVSFDIRQGEVIGVIGRNGAGKSTLLKILSRITRPTEGRAILRGRVASLLEVGTGFHPELTGRENVYLNGTILGMTKREVDRRFDEIVSFSGVEKFIDTPTKRYSSGMTVRLGFAVAAHLEPEILIVDEVLAVGDAEFQTKCIGKMSGVARSGRTVVFVSHNMAAVEHLCTRGIVLDGGGVVRDAPAEEAVAKYSELLSHEQDIPLRDRVDRSGSGLLKLSQARLANSMTANGNAVRMGDDWVLEMAFSGLGRLNHPQIAVVVESANGQRISRTLSNETYGNLPPIERNFSCQLRLGNVNLVAGMYYVLVDLSDASAGQVDRIERALAIEVLPRDVHRQGRVTHGAKSQTICYYDCEWRVPASAAASP
jgi:lipopolysaccharide transport system ATP-binding protein